MKSLIVSIPLTWGVWGRGRGPRTNHSPVTQRSRSAPNALITVIFVPCPNQWNMLPGCPLTSDCEQRSPDLAWLVHLAGLLFFSPSVPFYFFPLFHLFVPLAQLGVFSTTPLNLSFLLLYSSSSSSSFRLSVRSTRTVWGGRWVFRRCRLWRRSRSGLPFSVAAVCFGCNNQTTKHMHASLWL